MSNKYITFRLGDNDFGNAMLHAMGTMNDNFKHELLNANLDTIKSMIISLMVGYQIAHHCLWHKTVDIEKEFKHYYDYFKDSSISNELESTREDVDSGAVSIDLNKHVDYIWLH